VNILDRMRQRIERVMSSPGEELGRWARLLRFQLQLWRHCARRLWENNVTAMSAALSFRTIFALVPALVLAVLVLRSVGALEDSRQSLRRVLEGSGFAQIAVVERTEGTVDADGRAEDAEAPDETPVDADDKPSRRRTFNVADEIERMVDGVEEKLTFQRVGPVGAVLLVWTALSLITTLERSLNRVFKAPSSRPLGRRLLLYWSVLTLGPLVSAAAAYGGRWALDVFRSAPGASWLLAAVGWLGPIVVGVLVVAAVYKLLPNTRVRYRSALGGALISVPLWLLAKWGFSIYVSRLVTTGNLYGALGLLPLFLIWLNLSWLIILFGAQLAHTAANLHTMGREREGSGGPLDYLAVAAVVHLAFRQGEGPIVSAEIASRMDIPVATVERLLAELVRRRIVCVAGPDEDESMRTYLPERPAERISLLDVLSIEDGSRKRLGPVDCAPGVAAALDRTVGMTRSALGQATLADVLNARGDSGEASLSALRLLDGR